MGIKIRINLNVVISNIFEVEIISKIDPGGCGSDFIDGSLILPYFGGSITLYVPICNWSELPR